MRTKTALISAAVMALLSACGGGGGGAGAGFVAGVTAVSGFAAKGVISQAKVLVCRIKDGKIEADSSCAVGSTTDSGAYTVSMLDGWSGPVLVKVQATANSQMLDETTGTRQPFTAEIRAVVPTAATPAHVTPFTDIAATAVIKEAATGSVDSAKVVQANYMVQNTLGVDLTTKPVVDATAEGSEVGKQLGMVVALTKFLKATNTLAAGCTSGDNLKCALDNMRSSVVSSTSLSLQAKTQMAQISGQTVANLYVPIIDRNGAVNPKQVNPSDATAIQTAMTAVGATVDPGLANQITTATQQAVAAQTASVQAFNSATVNGAGQVVYTPPSTTAMSAIAQAKVLVNEVRTTFNYYVNQSGTGFLDLQRARIETDSRGLLFGNIDFLTLRSRIIDLGISLYDDLKATNGNYATGTDDDGTYYIKYIGDFNNLSNYWGDQIGNYYGFCRTKSNITAANLDGIYCVHTVLSGVQWKSYTPSGGASNVAVRNHRTVLKPDSTGSTFTYQMTPMYSSGVGVWPNVRAVNFSGKFTREYNDPNYGAFTIPVTGLAPGYWNYSQGLGNALGTSACFNANPTRSLSFDSDTLTWTSGACVSYVGTGSVSRSKGTDGTLTSLTLSGTGPLTNPYWEQDKYDTKGIGYEQYAVNMTKSTTTTPNVNRYRLNGSVISNLPVFNADGTIKTNTGSQSKMELPASTSADSGTYTDVKEETSTSTGVTSYTPVTMRARIKLTANSTSWDGVLSASNFANDKSGTCLKPTTVAFKGDFADNSSGGAGIFLSFDATGTMTGLANYSCNMPETPTNFAGRSIVFTGTIKAPGRPDTKLILSGSQGFTAVAGYGSPWTETVNVDFSYNAGATSADKFQFTGTLTRYPAGGPADPDIVLVSQDGIRMRFKAGTDTKIFKINGAAEDELGLWKSNGVIYFKDGTFVSL